MHNYYDLGRPARRSRENSYLTVRRKKKQQTSDFFCNVTKAAGLVYLVFGVPKFNSSTFCKQSNSNLVSLPSVQFFYIIFYLFTGYFLYTTCSILCLQSTQQCIYFVRSWPSRKLIERNECLSIIDRRQGSFGHISHIYRFGM